VRAGLGVRRAVLACVVTLAAAAVALRAMGRPWWCACGEPFLWSGQVLSRHNSQHLFDPYTFTHFSHGILLVWSLRLVLGRRRAASPLGVVVAVVLEAAWEVFENTDFVIRRYREATISLDYYGDSIANSLGDIFAMLVAYLATMRLGFRWGLLGLVVIDVVLAFWIRDGLILNVLMLVWPIAAIREWQAAVGHL
jgi:hypothetical protein